MSLSPGTRLGSYELLASLGEGGMGEVYRARDARLSRDVAVKVLPAELAGDADRLARFEQEARSASSLNHPNIVTVHEIGTSDGISYIAMELVDGKTLRELLVSGGLPVRRLLPIAAQIADGLAKAHESGIVHRDLKPENVMVNRDGFVKILDFGLAKLSAPLSDAGSQLATLAGPGTRPGMVMGTVGYMSPEQASGEAVDFRSDQFSLGSILYEMATGKRAFQKKTAIETLSAIIREDPEPMGAANPQAPPPLRWVVERCLAKEPENRYASTRDLARDLKQTLDHLSETSLETPALPRPKGRRGFLWLAAAAVLSLLAADVAVRARSAGRTPVAPTSPRLTRLTFGPGLEDEPALSPDGKFLAYTTDERGNLDVVVLPLAGGETIRVAASDADEAQPAWSPDGSRLAFVSARDHGGRMGIALNSGNSEPYLNLSGGDIFLVTALGGTPVRLVENAYHPSWSPDGRRIVYTAFVDGQWDLWTVPVEGGTPARVTHDLEMDFHPSWSPDGKWVADVCGPANGPYNIRAVPAAGGPTVFLTRGLSLALKPAWLPGGGGIVFSAETESILNLWRLRFDAARPGPSEPTRVTLGSGQDVIGSLSSDGKRLAFAAVQSTPNIWELEMASGKLRQLTFGLESTDHPRASPDGKTLLVASRRTGLWAAWTLDLDGNFLAQLTPGDDVNPVPEWSRDGRRISYLKDNKLCIKTVGSLSAKETGLPAWFSIWSPDDREILSSRPPSGKSSVLVSYSLGDGKLRTVASFDDALADDPEFSADGRQIAFQLSRGAGRELWLIPSQGGTPRQLTKDNEDSHPSFNPRNPDEILFTRGHKRLALVHIGTGAVRLIPGYSTGNYILDYPSWSPDGSRVYFSVYRKSGDIFLLENF